MGQRTLSYRTVIQRCFDRPDRVRLDVHREGDGAHPWMGFIKTVAVQRNNGAADRYLTRGEAEQLSLLVEQQLESGRWMWGGGETFVVRLDPRRD